MCSDTKIYNNKKAMWLTSFGATIEYFEFSLYGALGAYLTVLFFPNNNPTVEFLQFYGVFAISFFMRPLGGLILGHIGDKLGRKKALKISITMMMIPMIVMTFMPTYETAGIYAIAILFFARILQGISMGGEYTGVLVMVTELADEKRRGLAASIVAMTSQFGYVLAIVTVAILASCLSKEQIADYGWRIAFFVGVVLSVIAYIMQTSVKDSPVFNENNKKIDKKNKTPIFEVIRTLKLPMLWVCVLSSCIGIAYYMMATYLPNMFISSKKINLDITMWIFVVTSSLYMIVSPIFGWLSDIYGRKVIINIPLILLFILLVPLFKMFESGNFYLILIAVSIFSVLIAAMTASFQVTINELFPAEYRYTGVSVAYNTGHALFAGSSPFVSVLLVDMFDTNLAPAYYLMIFIAITLMMIYKMPETNPIKNK